MLETVGPYEPLEVLAEGGMARVLVAKRPGLAGFERRVALKVILEDLAQDEEYTAMFLDEARMCSRIQHPNVVSVLDVGRDPASGTLYMAMDLVLGATLSQVLRAHKQPLDPAVGLELVAQIAEGLDAAHCATDADGTPLAIVHRDVSPQNVLIGLDGFVRVSDFGIARAARRLSETRTGHFKGKLAYSSPEHVMGERLDHRSDIFALGIVAFETLTHVRLFKGRTPAETLDRIVRRDIPSITELRADLPEDAARVIDAALRRDVTERPARAAEIAERIRQATTRAGFETAAPRIREVVRRAATEQVVRLAGLDARTRAPSGPPAATDEAVTQASGPIPRDTILDLDAAQIAAHMAAQSAEEDDA